MARVSRKGVRFVAAFEGFRSCPYRDPVGVWTVGYGTTNGVGPASPCISEREARKRLRQDLNRVYLPAIPRRLRMRRCELDALASFAYNLGVAAVSSPSFSSLARRLKSAEGRTYKARKRVYEQELPKWVNAGGRPLPGLVRRRAAEVRLATKGIYE